MLENLILQIGIIPTQITCIYAKYVKLGMIYTWVLESVVL